MVKPKYSLGDVFEVGRGGYYPHGVVEIVAIYSLKGLPYYYDRGALDSYSKQELNGVFYGVVFSEGYDDIIPEPVLSLAVLNRIR